MALGLDELLLEREVVLDDAVVDDGHATRSDVRVRVLVSLGRPWVAQRVWPMPVFPWGGSAKRRASRFFSLPVARTTLSWRLSRTTATPAES